jgi:uncharacterized ferritin-like protein (DUF455 family)
MKRLIDPDELARDRRFVRAKSRNTLLETMPDDVDAIVELMEKVGPKLADRVRGTALEEMYERMGPGFAFLSNLVPVESEGPETEYVLRLRMHGTFVGELQALEGAGRTLWDFPDAPWEFKMNMARQCWDEARHVLIFEKLIDHTGGEIGEFPETTFLFEAACADDPVLRVAGVNRCLEGLACDTFRALRAHGHEKGDAVLEQSMDFVLADELTHVRFGSDWVKAFCEEAPEKKGPVKDFQLSVERRFSFGGGRSDRDDAAIPIAWEDRKAAGFSEEELQELAEVAGRGPSRQTLVRAAEILRKRHHARRAEGS